VGQYQTKLSFYNNLEESMSILEKTSKKLLPIYKEVLEKISVIEKKKEAGKKLFDQFEI
jgi:phage-related holin